MSEVVDNKIVEMQFNNADFEKNIKESLQSLQRIEKAIDNLPKSANGFDKLAKSANNMDFSKLLSNVDYIAKRMTVTGIATMKVIADVTGFIEKKVVGLGKKIGSMIIEGGKKRAANIEQAKFQLRGLGIEWAEVAEDVDYAVSGTAYGLDAAAKAASQLSASGVEFGETFGPTGSSPMAKALRGISGVAAMTNSSYEEIAHIFTSVAGQGKVMTMQLNQISMRGLNAASTIVDFINRINTSSEEDLANISENVLETVADITGGAQITEKTLRDLVTEGKISFELFSEAMDDAFGEHAKDANMTFEGTLSNIRSAFSRIGQNFFAPIKENGGPLVRVLNEVRLLINEINASTKTVISGVARGLGSVLYKISMISYYLRENDGWLNIIEGFGNILKTIGDIISPIFMAFRKFFPEITAQGIYDLTESFWLFTEQLRLSDDTMKSIFTIARAVADVFNTLKDIISAFINALSPGAEALLYLLDSILYGTAYVIAFTSALLKLTFTSERVAGFGEFLRNVFYSIFYGIQDLIDGVLNFSSALFDLLGEFDVFKEIGDFFKDLATLIVFVFVKAVQKASEVLNWFRESLANVNKEDLRPYIEGLNNLLRIFVGLAKTAGGVILQVGKFILDAISKIKPLNDIISSIKNPIDTANGALRIFNNATEKLSDTFSDTSVSVNEFIDSLGNTSSKSASYLKNVENGISSLTDTVSAGKDEFDKWKASQDALINSKSSKWRPRGRERNVTGSAEIYKTEIQDIAQIKRSLSGVESETNNILKLTGSVKNLGAVTRSTTFGLGELNKKVSTFAGFEDRISGVAASAKQFKKAVSEIPTEKITRDGKNTSNVLTAINLGIKEVSVSSNNLNDTVSKLKLGEKLTQGLVDDGKSGIRKFFDGIVEAIREAIGRISPALLKVVDAIVGIGKFVIDKIKLFVSTVIGFVKKLDWGRGVVLAFVAVWGYAVLQIAKLIGSIPYLMWSVGQSVQNLTGALNRLVGAKQDTLYTGILKLSLAIGVFAASLYAIAKIPAERLKSSIAIVAGFVAALVAASYAITTYLALPVLTEKAGAVGFNAIAVGILAMAASIGALAITLKILEDVEFDKVGNSLAGFLIALISFSTGAALLLPRLKGLTLGSGVIFLFAISITSIVKSLKSLEELKPEQIDSAMVGLSVTIAALSALVEVAKTFPLKSGLGIIALVAAIMLIPKAFNGIVKSGFSFDYLAKNIEQLVVAFILLASLAAVIRIAGEGSIGIAASILAITMALKALPGVIKSLVDTIKANKPEDIDRATGAIITLMIGLGVVFALTAACSGLSLKAAPIFMSIATAILLMSVCVKLLSTIGLGGIISAGIALGGMYAVLTTLALISKATKDAQIKPIIGFMALLLILVGSIALLSFIPFGSLITATFSLVLTLGVIYLCFQELANIDRHIAESSRVVLSMTVVIAALAASLYFLNKLDIISLTVSAAMLATLIVTVSLAIQAISKMQTKDAVPGILSLSAMIIAIGGALFLLSKFCEPGAIIASATSLFVVGVALGVFLAITDQLKNAKQSAGILIMLSVGLIAIAGAFLLFKNLEMGSVVAGLVGMAGALAILLVAAAIANIKPVAAGLEVLCLAFIQLGMAAIEFGVAAALIGAGVLLISASFSILASALSVIVGLDLSTIIIGLIGIGDAIGHFSIAMLGFTIAAIPFGLALVALAVAISVLSAAITIIGGAMTVASIGIMQLASSFGILFVTFASLLAIDLSLISSGLAGFALSLVALSIAAIPFVAIGPFLTGILLALGVSIGILSLALLGFSVAINSIVNALSIFAAFANINSEVASAIQGTIGILGSAVQSFFIAGKNIIGGIVNGAKSVIGTLKSTGETIGSALKEGFEKDGISGMIAAGADAIKGLVFGVDSNSGEAVAAFSRLAESALYDGFAPTAEWESPWGTLKRAGQDAVSGLSEGIGSGLTEVGKTGTEMATTFLDGFRDETGWHSDWDTMIEAAKDAISGFFNSTKENGGILGSIGAWLGDVFGGGFKGSVDNAMAEAEAMVADFMNQNDFDYETERRFINKKLGELEYDQTKANDGEWWSNDPSGASARNREREKIPEAPGGGGGGGGGAASAEVKKSTDIMDYAKEVVEKFNESYGKLYDELGETANIEASKKAVTDFAKVLYEMEGGVLDGTDEALAEMLEHFEEFNTSLKQSMKSALKSTEEFKRSFDFAPKDLFKNMDSNKRAIRDFQNYLVLARKKGYDEKWLLELASAGFSEESLDKLQYYCSQSADFVEEYNKRLKSIEEDSTVNYEQFLADWIAINQKKAGEFKSDNSFTQALETKLTEWTTVFVGWQRNYQQAAATVEENIKSTVNHFKKFTVNDEDKKITIEDLIENEESQKKGMQKFYEHLKSIMDKGGSKELVEKIESMGYEAGYAYAKSIDDGTTEQIQKLGGLYTETETLLPKELGADYAHKFADIYTEGIDTAFAEISDYFKEAIESGKLIPEELGNFGLAFYKQMFGENWEVYEPFFKNIKDNLGNLLTNKELNDLLSTNGTKLSTTLSEGMTSKEANEALGKAVKSVSGITLDAFTTSLGEHQGSLEEIEAIGSIVPFSFENGIVKNITLPEDAAKMMSEGVVETTEGIITLEKFKGISDNIIEGLRQGIYDGKDTVLTEIRKLCSDIAETTEEETEISSPSKLFARYGRFIDLGLAQGISSNSDIATNESKSLAERTVDSFNTVVGMINDILADNMDYTPTITPVLDSSMIQNGMGYVNSMLGGSFSLGIGGRYANAISSAMSDRSDNSDSDNKANGNTYNFTQNNYSPKALSRLDIYRQTRNQFTRMKGMVEAR